MSIEKGRAYFRALGLEDRVQELPFPPQPLSLRLRFWASRAPASQRRCPSKPMTACLSSQLSDARIDNHKFKDISTLGEDALGGRGARAGRPPGRRRVPFGINEGIPVYLDESLKRFETVFPAVGSASSAIELNLDELYRYSNAKAWIDVCKLPGHESFGTIKTNQDEAINFILIRFYFQHYGVDGIITK